MLSLTSRTSLPPRSTLFPYTTLFRSGPVWSPTGDRIAFASSVYPECTTDACNAEKDEAKESNAVKARVTDELMYRSEEHTSELQSQSNLVCRLLLEKKK